MSIEITGRNVLITGANRGIGKCILEAMLDAGAAKVYAAVRDPATAQPLVETHGDKVVPVRLDLTEPATITAAARTAGDAEIVINNGGILKTASPLDEVAIDHLQQEMEVNVYGLMRMAQAFAPVLAANGGGAFVQLNSVVSMKAFSDMATYCTSKAAAYSITQSLREVLGDQDTQVLSVHPGPIATDMAKEAGMADMGDPPEVVAKGIVEALRRGDFHLFPDSFATQLGDAYASFAETIIEADLMEG